jgi:NADPH-dependent 2,4-dienoyl-CoA reductase/sulfur reductase-like enzyme
MRVVVIGCTHAGTSAVKTILKENPDAEVTVFERNDNISFLSCGIAYISEELLRMQLDCFIRVLKSCKGWVQI